MKLLDSYLKKRSDKKLQNAKNIMRDNGFSYFNSSLNFGGLHNRFSGIGTENDKSRQSIFLPTLISSKSTLEVLLNESWSAKRFVHLPIDQMFIRPRVFNDLDEEVEKRYLDYLASFDLNDKFSRAMKCGRLYGSGFLLFITKEAPLHEPLIVDELQPNDLLNILVFDRYSVYIQKRCFDLTSKRYQKPEIYHVSPRYGRAFEIHESRVLRFDGQQSLGDDGWTTYDVDYGVSEIIPVLQSIYQETQSANGISQLIEEASIAVFKTSGFKDTLGINPAPDAPNLAQLTQAINQYKSIYHSVFMDKDDEFSRQEVNLSGLGDILNAFASRLAAAAGIPATIFLGKSPLGMNATGESDLEINAANVAAMQKNRLTKAYEFIDKIMTKTGGFENNFSFEFPSLLDSSDKDKVDVAYQKAQTVVQLVQSDIITSDEAREVLSGDDVLGTYEAQGVDFAKEIAAQKALNAQNEQNENNTTENLENDNGNDN